MRFLSHFENPTPALENRIGERGRSLTRLTGLGIPVPSGFAISDVACRRFLETGEFPEVMRDELIAMVDDLRTDGRPLLLAVRSSPPVNMPGLLANVLNVGISDDTLADLEQWGSVEVARTTHADFLAGFGATVRSVPVEHLQRLDLTDTSAAGITALRGLIKTESQRPIPDSLHGQLTEAIEAVFASWDNPEPRAWRRRRQLSDDLGTVAVVHLMTIGNLGDASGVGVAFSRDPADGANRIRGVYRPGGNRPESVEQYRDLETLRTEDPAAHEEVVKILKQLEADSKDAVRIEFVRERGRLWLLEARTAERSAAAAVTIAVDLVDDGIIDAEQAIHRVEADLLGDLLHGQLAPHQTPSAARGVGASPGAATGAIVFDPAEASRLGAGKPLILVRREATAEDTKALPACAGLLTTHGGRTSHPAVVARGIGTPAVTGASTLSINVEAASLTVGDQVLHAGDTITIDGTSGDVFISALTVVPPQATDHLDRLLSWADAVRRLDVWANADTPDVAAAALEAGAAGLGLVRTEYMFAGERLAVVQGMLLAKTAREEADALEELERLQVEDFVRLLEVMDGLPVIVRLLDPPLHEFLPDRHDLGDGDDELADLLEGFAESNPMLGLRGVRLAVVNPAIYRVQVLAALEAVRRRLDAGGDPRLALMIPLVGTVEELHLIRDMIDEEVHYAGRQLEVAIGTMIELPRAALVADEIAIESDFFSFGTNDLTQTTLGLSRDDAEGAFLDSYLEQGLFERNPFQSIDTAGVGRLIAMAIEDGRRVNGELEIGVCGEHGADPRSIDFFHRVGVDYVSCSPPRIPVARLAAAQAALRERDQLVENLTE